MRRILSLVVLILVIFSICVAAADVTEYSSRNILCGDDIAYSLTYCDGMLYGLFESGLYKVEPSGEKSLVAASSELQPGIVTILTDHQSVYAVACENNQALLLQLTDETGTYINKSVLTLDYETEMDFADSVLCDGFLYYPVRENFSTEVTVARINISDETESFVSIDNMVCFDVMDNGDIIAETRESNWPDDIVLIQTVSPETGKINVWADINKDGYACKLVYDAESDTVYLLAQREIYIAEKDGELISTNLSFSQDVIDFCFLSHGLAATTGDMLKICSFNGTSDQKIVLSVCGPYAEDEYFTSFYESHPTVELRTVNLYAEEPEEKYIRDVLTQNPDIDIFILHDLNMLSTIKEKGYYADLAKSETIKEKVSRMYTPFIRALSDGDKIAAFPHPYYVMFASINYNKTLFDKLKIPVPTTWDEYFDFCIDWKNQYEDENPDVSVNPFEHDLSFVTLLEHYDDEMARDGIPADYQSEMLESVLRKYLQVKELYSNEDHFGTPLFYDYDLNMTSDATFEYETLPLTFVKDADPIFTPMEEDIYYFVVNPYSAHIQEAIECVASAQDAGRNNEPYIYTEIPDLPLVNVYYDEALDMYQEQLNMLEEQKSKAEDDPDITLTVNEKIDTLTKEMQNYAETKRYWFTEDDMIPFRTIVSHVYFSDFNPVKAIYADDPEFFENITEETLSNFLRVLDNKVKMVRLEKE